MKLIAKKPCSFGGRQFYIGDEIPENFVADALYQEKMGVIAIVKDRDGVSGRESGDFFTLEQVEKMIAEAVDEAVNNTIQEMEQKELQEGMAILHDTDSLFENTVFIPVNGESDGENIQQTAISAAPEEIRQVFRIMQMNAADGAEAIADVKSENVLILLHAADSRKTVKNAAKEQADKLFSTKEETNESTGGNATTGTHIEGS